MKVCQLRYLIMRSSVQKTENSIRPNAKPNISAVMTTEQRARSIVNHPYKDEDSSGSQKQVHQKVERDVGVRGSESGRPASIAYTKKMSTVRQKRKTLQQYKYINPLARIDYEDKLEQVYTKFTKMSKASVVKKIKAKNRIAEFSSEDEEINDGFDQLLEYKFGADKSEKIYFEKEQIIQYEFCEFCDTVHNDHAEAHTVLCEKKRRQDPEKYSPYSQQYMAESLYRIKLVVETIKSPEFEQLLQCLMQLQKLIDPTKSAMVKNKAKVLNSIKELKQIYCSDSIFVKIIAKVCYLVEKI